MYGAQIRNPFAVGLHYFQILLIHPEDAVEERVLPVQHFRAHLKDVAIHFVHLFRAQVLQVVFGHLPQCDRIGRNTRQVLRIFRLELQVLQRGFRGGDGFFVELAVAGTHRIVRGVVFSRGLAVGAIFLNADRFPVGIQRPRGLVKIFLLGEGLDDLRGRQRGRRFSLRHAHHPANAVFLRRRERAGRIFLRGKANRGQEKEK